MAAFPVSSGPEHTAAACLPTVSVVRPASWGGDTYIKSEPVVSWAWAQAEASLLESDRTVFGSRAA